MAIHPPMLYLGFVGTDDPLRLRDVSTGVGRFVDRLDQGDAALDANRLDLPQYRD